MYTIHLWQWKFRDSRWFRSRRAIGLAVIEFNCPSASKATQNFQKIFSARNTRIILISAKTVFTYSHLVNMQLCILCPIESVDTFVMQLFKFRDDFDDDGQLDSIAPSAAALPKGQLNPTARRRRNIHDFNFNNNNTIHLIRDKFDGEKRVRTFSGFCEPFPWICSLQWVALAICFIAAPFGPINFPIKLNWKKNKWNLQQHFKNTKLENSR